MQTDTRVDLEELRGRIKRLEALMEVGFSARDESLRIQAVQYESRLTALNGEQDRIAKIQETYVTRERFEWFTTHIFTALTELREKTAGIKSEATGVKATITIAAAIAALLVSLLGMLLK